MRKESPFRNLPLCHCQQLLQGKWTILILYQLSTGTKRFKELQRAIEVTQATLSTHLKQLEREGLIQRTVYPEVPPRVEYSLTTIGWEFQPVLESIHNWGKQYIHYLEENR